MTLGIGQLGASYPAPDAPQRSRFTPSPPPAFTAAVRTEDRVELSHGAPPPELLEEVAKASSRALELAMQNRELHFSKDEESGRIIVQVRDMEGHVIKTIPGEHALDVMAGAEL